MESVCKEQNIILSSLIFEIEQSITCIGGLDGTDLVTNFIGGLILMISAGEFRNGITFEFEGNVYQIVEFQHVKPCKGAAFVRTKLKNVITGGVVEKTFRPTEKCEKAHIDRRDMQFSYVDGDL